MNSITAHDNIQGGLSWSSEMAAMTETADQDDDKILESPLAKEDSALYICVE